MEGEVLNTSGLSIKFEDDSSEPITITEYTTVPVNGSILKRGTSFIQVNYKKDNMVYSTSIPIIVKYPVDIEVNYLKKSNYKVGEDITLEGSDIVVIYNDGKKKRISDISNIQVSPETYSDDKLITISYSINDEQFITKYEINKITEIVGAVDPRIVTFASGTNEEINKMLIRHYNNEINIADYWKVGDIRESAGENYKFVIIGLNVTDDAGQKFAVAIMGFNLHSFSSPKVSYVYNRFYNKYYRINQYRHYVDYVIDGNPKYNKWVGNNDYYNIELDGTRETASESSNLNNNNNDYYNNVYSQSPSHDMIKYSKFNYSTIGSCNLYFLKNLENVEIKKSIYVDPDQRRDSYGYYDSTKYYYTEIYFKNATLEINIAKKLVNRKYHMFSKDQLFGGGAFPYFKTKSNRILKESPIASSPTEYILRDYGYFDSGTHEKELTFNATLIQNPNLQTQVPSFFIYSNDNYGSIFMKLMRVSTDGDLIANTSKLLTLNGDASGDINSSKNEKYASYYLI